MPTLFWSSDPHLNFLRHSGAARAFGEYVKSQDIDTYEPEVRDGKQAVVITGDIAECSNLEYLLTEFIAGVGVPVYFVLGNHDLYGGSQAKAHAIARGITKDARGGVWLTEAGVVELAPGVALVGHDGWYDARNGNPHRLEMTDFSAIEDLVGRNRDGGWKKLPRPALILRVQALADKAVREAEVLVRAAAAKYPTVYFATHVPPFARAAWHAGTISDGDWLPFMSCKAMGDMLVEVAYEFPDVNFTVLCGHTHGNGEYTPVPNLSVWTAEATYGNPQIYKVIEV